MMGLSDIDDLLIKHGKKLVVITFPFSYGSRQP